MKQRELKEAVEMLNYKIDVLTPVETRVYSNIHDGSVLIDEVNGGYKVYGGDKMLDIIKYTVLELVKIYSNTPLDRREAMNGTKIVDYYKRKENNELQHTKTKPRNKRQMGAVRHTKRSLARTL